MNNAMEAKTFAAAMHICKGIIDNRMQECVDQVANQLRKADLEKVMLVEELKEKAIKICAPFQDAALEECKKFLMEKYSMGITSGTATDLTPMNLTTNTFASSISKDEMNSKQMRINTSETSAYVTGEEAYSQGMNPYSSVMTKSTDPLSKTSTINENKIDILGPSSSIETITEGQTGLNIHKTAFHEDGSTETYMYTPPTLNLDSKAKLVNINVPLPEIVSFPIVPAILPVPINLPTADVSTVFGAKLQEEEPKRSIVIETETATVTNSEGTTSKSESSDLVVPTQELMVESTITRTNTGPINPPITIINSIEPEPTMIPQSEMLDNLDNGVKIVGTTSRPLTVEELLNIFTPENIITKENISDVRCFKTTNTIFSDEPKPVTETKEICLPKRNDDDGKIIEMKEEKQIKDSPSGIKSIINTIMSKIESKKQKKKQKALEPKKNKSIEQIEMINWLDQDCAFSGIYAMLSKSMDIFVDKTPKNMNCDHYNNDNYLELLNQLFRENPLSDNYMAKVIRSNQDDPLAKRNPIIKMKISDDGTYSYETEDSNDTGLKYFISDIAFVYIDPKSVQILPEKSLPSNLGALPDSDISFRRLQLYALISRVDDTTVLYLRNKPSNGNYIGDVNLSCYRYNENISIGQGNCSAINIKQFQNSGLLLLYK